MLMHAWLDGQSWFMAHSGLQFGGRPWKSCIHEHDGESLISLQTAWGPHGLGTHGFLNGLWGICITVAEKNTKSSHCKYLVRMEVKLVFVLTLRKHLRSL